MSVYIQLVRFTEKGIANVEASPGRLDAAKAVLQEMGDASSTSG